VPLFCRHNRLLAECPICSKGTALDRGQTTRRGKPAPSRRRPAEGPRLAFTGPYGAAGPYEDEAGVAYEVRVERVPGGLRLAEWTSTALRRKAPVLRAADLPSLIAQAVERADLPEPDASALTAALRAEPEAGDERAFGASPGRSGELRDELRVEPLPGGRVRIARWVKRPGADWELQDAPVLLPAARLAEAIEHSVRRGLLAGASEARAGARP
jgi:hypothetical protein